MEAPIDRVVIIGAGQAGIQVALGLRKRKFTGAIVMLGDEPYAPYQRPPLSKAYLKGSLEEERLFFQAADFFVKQDIDLHTGDAAVRMDTKTQTVSTQSGRQFEYDVAVLATGATPRNLPGHEGTPPKGLHVLRGLDDAKRLREVFRPGARLTVIGGGYIGLETASAARQMGHNVTVLERAPRLLARVAGAPVSAFYERYHREQGVDVRCDVVIDSIEIREGAVAAVRLLSGEEIPSDVVLVGIGVTPNVALAIDAGIECRDGVVVDAFCRTSSPGVFAAGDCARRRIEAYKDEYRLESVHNALDHGDRIASAIVGAPQPAYDPPWFWSDQYDIKLQTAGLFCGAEDFVYRGDPQGTSFAVFYFDGPRFLAVDAINDPASFLTAKQILKSGAALSREQAADRDFPLKSLIARPRANG